MLTLGEATPEDAVKWNHDPLYYSFKQVLARYEAITLVRAEVLDQSVLYSRMTHMTTRRRYKVRLDGPSAAVSCLTYTAGT